MRQAKDLRPWVGSYWSDELAATATVELDEDRLTYRVGSLERREMVVRVDGSASLAGLRLDGELGEAGRIEGFVIDAGRVRGIRFERRD